MQDDRRRIEAAAQHVIELEEELEASGVAALDDHRLAALRTILHQWVDAVQGVVISPAVGRVTVIDVNGKRTSIGSSELAFRLSAAGASTTAA